MRLAGTLLMTGENRIMIKGPKNDGTYVLEFRTVAGEGAGDLNTENRDCGDPALSRAHAAWALRAGCSIKNPTAKVFMHQRGLCEYPHLEEDFR